MISELTKEQQDKFPEYVKKWVDFGLSTEPVSFERVIETAKACYRSANLPEPIFFAGPFNTPIESYYAGVLIESEFVGKTFKDNDDFNSQVKAAVAKGINTFKCNNVDVYKFGFGGQEYWLSIYDFFNTELKIEDCKRLEALIEHAKECGWWIPMAGVCIFTHRPKAIHRDTQNRIHNPNGPAIEFYGDYKKANVYAIHGVRVPAKIIEEPITVADIDAEQNAEVRRVMIDRYGQAQYLQDSNAVVLNQDDFGTLYRKELPGDEAIVMVKVVNSTPEPDGSFKDYFIRVDPNAYGGLKTAQQAVASTWRNKDGSMLFPDPNQYDPDVQT